MPHQNERILIVEDPDSTAVVDFLSRGVHLRISINDEGVLTVSVQASHGETTSTFDTHEWEALLPDYVKDT